MFMIYWKVKMYVCKVKYKVTFNKDTYLHIWMCIQKWIKCSSYPWGIYSKSPSSCLKLEVGQNPSSTVFPVLTRGSIYHVNTGDKGWFMFQAGRSRVVWDFITLFRMVHHLELMNFIFLEFSIYYFRLGWSCVTKTKESKTADKGRQMYTML